MIESEEFEYNTEETISQNFHRFVLMRTTLYDDGRNPFATKDPSFDAMEARVDGANPPVLVVNVDCDQTPEALKEIAIATFDFMGKCLDEIMTAMRTGFYPNVAFIRG